MYDIKAHEVVYRGAHFRSKNECKRYIFFKQLGWNVEYEPVLEDIKGWLPDFAIYGDKNKKILVEVKPYQTMRDFETDYAKSVEKKIHDSGWYGNYDSVLIFGSTLNLGEASCGDNTFLGGKCFRKAKYDPDWPNNYSGKIINGHQYYPDEFAYTNRGLSDEQIHRGDIDVCDAINSYIGHIWDPYDGGYCLSDEAREKIETAWNHAGSEMRYVKRVA